MLERRSNSKLVGTLGALLAATLLIALAKPAEAALFIVDTKALDAGDLIPGDGKCEWATIVPVGQRCTLRAAVQEANALAGADVVIIPDGWHIVLTNAGAPDDASPSAATGDLDILENLAIGGFLPPSPDAWPVVDGTGLPFGLFEVHAPAVLTLASVQITNRRPLGSGPNITVATGAGGDFSMCRFYGNTIHSVLLNRGDSTISGCSIEGNSSSPHEAILNLGTLEIVGSTVASNSTPKAIQNDAGALLTIRNSTVTANSGEGVSSKDDLVLRNVTIFANAGVGLRHNQPGAFASPSIKNSILAGNLQDCLITVPGGAADTAHPNLDSDGSCGFLPAFGGLPNTDPKLGLPQLNGGTTRTMVPEVGSPVIDSGNNGTCENVDQRGASRPLDGNETAGVDCDIGAVEVLPCVGTPFLVVTGGFISIPVTYTGCFSITAGPALEVTATGDVTFRTRDAVRFTNGFSVLAGGKLQVVLDPAAGSGITLP